jgi:hypothetical protein
MKHLILGIFFILFSKGNNVLAQSPNLNVSAEKLDTLKVIRYSMATKPVIFETAFFEGTQVDVDTVHLQFYSIDIGKINIESGKIIACDPIILRDMKPFAPTFPIGQFPVHLSIVKFHNDERVAFSRILFSDKPVAKWEFALQNGQKQASIFGDTFYSYSVDAGIGLFLDEKAKDEFIKDDSQSILDGIFNEMDKHTHVSWQYGICKLNGHNLVAFSTGFGDGHYATYVGYDNKGRPCRLLTDFGMVQWWTK